MVVTDQITQQTSVGDPYARSADPAQALGPPRLSRNIRIPSSRSVNSSGRPSLASVSAIVTATVSGRVLVELSQPSLQKPPIRVIHFCGQRSVQAPAGLGGLAKASLQVGASHPQVVPSRVDIVEQRQRSLRAMHLCLCDGAVDPHHHRRLHRLQSPVQLAYLLPVVSA